MGRFSTDVHWRPYPLIIPADKTSWAQMQMIETKIAAWETKKRRNEEMQAEEQRGEIANL